MNRGASGLAERLAEAKARVVSHWEERARRRMPEARRQDPPALLDGLPELLDELVHSLGGCPSPRPTPPLEEDSHVASSHGRQRALATDYSLDQVLSEYELLRAVLFEELELDGRALPPDERDALLTELEMRIRAAATEFARVRAEERDRARRELEELNRRLDDAVREQTGKLLRTEARFASLVEGVKDYAIFTVDPQGLVTSWNKGAERMKQYTTEDILGTHFSILYTEEGRMRDEPMAHLRAAALEGRFRGEGVRRRKNGEHFLADVLITPMYDGDELIGFSKVVQDLTERSSLLQERDLLLVDANRLRLEAHDREQFVASLSHDLRNPLSVARTAAQLIERSPAAAERAADLARRITCALERADRMLVDLLDASRLEAGKGLKLDLEECDLAKIAAEVCAELAARHGPRFTVIAESEAKGLWNADALRRILENLLSNAVKYGDPTTPITVRLRSRVDRRILFVHNFGPPIAIEDQADLFRPFHRARKAEASHQHGWGLGLALVRGLVEALEGDIMLASYPNEGTTFTIDLPADPTRVSRG